MSEDSSRARIERTAFNTSIVGAASELAACTHLMLTGYYVYRCESPTAPFDLVAYRNGQTLRVEVKTLRQSSPTAVPQFVWPSNDEWDLLVVVDLDACVCIEILTHDPVEARQVIRRAYNHAPSTRRTREECALGVPARNVKLPAYLRPQRGDAP